VFTRAVQRFFRKYRSGRVRERYITEFFIRVYMEDHFHLL
jgi:hypothetical protein